MNKKTPQKNIFDLIEGYYLSHALIFLQEAGYFSGGKQKRKLAEPQLEQLLQVLSERTDIIKKKKNGKFAVADVYAGYHALGFHIEKLLQAYGHITPRKDRFSLKIDGKKFAEAYKKVVPYQDWRFLLNTIKQLPVNHLLDLGCGAGTLAVQFCKQKKERTAVGIDANKKMCSTAREFILKAKLSSRIKIYTGKAESFHHVLPANTIKQTDLVIASNLFNELVANGGTAAIRLLMQLKKYFPGKMLLVADYYGILGTPRCCDPLLSHNYVHDMIQLFSGQGVPPANYQQWQWLYQLAGCRLESVTEGTSQGVNWFVHRVLL